MSTTTLTMSDLVAGLWTATDDSDGAYAGYAHAARTWNGWRVCYFTDDVMRRIVADVSNADADWHLVMEDTDEGERVVEVRDDGETIPFARPVMVDGVRLWDTTDSGWTWTEAQDGCCECGDIFPLADLTDQTREGVDPTKVYVCAGCLNA